MTGCTPSSCPTNFSCKGRGVCIPPMPMDEVQSLHKYAVSYRAKAESEEIASHGFSTTKIGGDTQVGAGDIKLTIYKSDPIEYRLYVPAWKSFTAGGSGMVTLNAEEYGSAKLMATAVLAQTGEVCLDRYPGYWANIWSGVAGTEKKKPVVGLKKTLVDEATREGRVVVPPPADSRGCELVGWLLERLDTATPAHGRDRPRSRSVGDRADRFLNDDTGGEVGGGRQGYDFRH